MKNKIVIAHRGACGYLPEHTLASKALAFAMGADYLEQDLAMTKDNALIVIHDHFLDNITNVADLFPYGARKDGRYYVIDFTLDEIKQLSVLEPFVYDENGYRVNKFSSRFPQGYAASSFRLHTFEEEIEFILGLNQTTGKNIGIYPEIKAPWFHHMHGKDIALASLNVLKKYGYGTDQPNRKAFFQCFDPNELERVRYELLPNLNIKLPLIQLIADNSWGETQVFIGTQWQAYDYDWMFGEKGMAQVAEYADGIGPWHQMIIHQNESTLELTTTDLVKNAHANNLLVHPYTFRKDMEDMPHYVTSFEQWLKHFYFKLNVDGLFTDYCDIAAKIIREKK